MFIQLCVICVSVIQHEIVADKDCNGYGFVSRQNGYEDGGRLHFEFKKVEYSFKKFYFFTSIESGGIANGGTAVKVLCYKSEGCWFDSRWCQWNFSLT
jgi:hypothetical protein